MNTFSADTGGRDDGDYTHDGSLQFVAKKAATVSLPGMGSSTNRSLFIFSEENFIRKYAKIIIEWGYPLINIHKTKKKKRERW